MFNDAMNNPDEDLPEPYDLAQEAEDMPRKVPLRRYHAAMSILRTKGYSFAEIAEWISKRLGVDVTRSQVSYLLSTPPEVLAEEEEAEEAQAEADAEDENSR
jgi:hypothetical protein